MVAVSVDPVVEAQEQVQKYRDQLSGDPQNKSYQGSLGWSLTELLAPRLSAAGRKDEAAAAAREGIQIHLQLAADPGVARDHAVQYGMWAAAGAQHLPAAEAITAMESAVAALRKLHQDQPGDTVCSSYLGWTLTELLAPRLSAAGRKDEAAAAAREGIQIHLQ
ncbi:hypothetical protein, partial [Nocardia brasiliensis]